MQASVVSVCLQSSCQFRVAAAIRSNPRKLRTDKEQNCAKVKRAFVTGARGKFIDVPVIPGARIASVPPACRISLEKFQRVAHDVVEPYLEVQVRPRRATARSHFGDDLTAADHVARFNAHRQQVTIARSKAAAVIDLDHQAVRCAYGRAKRAFEVLTAVERDASGELIDPIAEPGVFARANGPSKPCAVLLLEQRLARLSFARGGDGRALIGRSANSVAPRGGMQHSAWIDRKAVLPNLKVQVRSRGSAGRADSRDQLPATHHVARLDAVICSCAYRLL